MTNFLSQHSQGNYGIEVGFLTADNSVISYNLDLNSFNGDPYRFVVYSPQSIVIKVQKNYIIGLEYIRLFQEDFEYDQYVSNGFATGKYNTTNENIFVKNIEIQYVDIQDLTENVYYLNISAPKGKSITPLTSSIDLVG
jgi:hypothetical protein